MPQKTAFLRVTRERVCPYCHQSDSLIRTHRPFFYRMLFFAPYRAYKCFSCGHKFVMKGEPKVSE